MINMEKLVDYNDIIEYTENIIDEYDHFKIIDDIIVKKKKENIIVNKKSTSVIMGAVYLLYILYVFYVFYSINKFL